MERIYFSKQNFNIIYGILKKKIITSSNYDIDTNESFHKELVNVMKTIYAKRNSQQFNVPSNISDIDHSRYLSQKCINIAMPYFEDSIKKIQAPQSQRATVQMNQLERDMTTSMNSQINRLSDRPMTNTRGNDNGPSTNARYDEIMKARAPAQAQQNMPRPVNFQDNNNQESNDDVQRRYSELTKNRENEYTSQPQTAQQDTNTFQHPSTNINEQFQSGNAAQMNNNVNLVIRDSNRAGYPKPPTQFNSFPQTNPNNIGSDINNNPFGNNTSAPSSNSLADQFKNVTSTSQTINTNVTPDQSQQMDMIPDNVDYNELMKQMEMPNPINNDTPDEFSGFDNINEQFQTSIINSKEIKDESIVPDTLVVNSDDKALEKVPKVNTIDNTEYQLLKEILQNQQVNLDDTSRRINDLVNIMEKQDLSTFYDTMINMPSLIAKQSNDTFALRKHNLVISSRDRDLTRTDFNKYSFKVDFGIEGDSINSNLELDNSASANGVARTDVKFASSGARNPNLVDVLRNIVEIKLTRVIIPRPRDEVFFPDPYYFVCIDEFDSNVVTTKRLSEKVFCKIHFDKEVVFGGIGGSSVSDNSEIFAQDLKTLALSSANNQISVGNSITGTNIPANTTISAIDSVNNIITLSNAATANIPANTSVTIGVNPNPSGSYIDSTQKLKCFASTQLKVGQTISSSASGIQTNTIINSIDTVNNTIVLSKDITGLPIS